MKKIFPVLFLATAIFALKVFAQEKPLPLYPVSVNVFLDTPEFIFREKYLSEEEKKIRRPTVYFRTVRELGHEKLLGEIGRRPIAGAVMTYAVVGKGGEVLDGGTLITNKGGQAGFEITGPLSRVEYVEIRADGSVGDVIPPQRILRVQPGELLKISPLYVWFVKTDWRR